MNWSRLIDAHKADVATVRMLLIISWNTILHEKATAVSSAKAIDATAS